MGWNLLGWLESRPRVSRRQRLRSPFGLLVEELESRFHPSTTFAVIGDFGSGDQNEADVANLVNSWNPEFVVTVGDNNYATTLSTATYDTNVGQFYSDYLFPYTGSYDSTATTNQFFPAIGNHDFSSTGGYSAYLGYFTLPGNERYYQFTWGEVEFFIVNSDSHEPDGRSSASKQAQWLHNALAASTATWQIVLFHHAAYASGSSDGGTATMEWPFEEWGADAVIAGHYHNYERLQIGNIPYFVNGIGGESRASFKSIAEGSQVRYNADFGAMLVIASETQINYQFINVDGVVIDNYTVTLSPLPAVTIAATDAGVSEAGPDGGVFAISRSGSTDAELVVNYTLSGTATNGDDYAFLGGSVTIAAGAATATLPINPVDDTVEEGNETVTVTLAFDSAYVLGSPAAATVTLADNDSSSQTLVPVGSIWKFLDDGSDQGTVWRQPSFDDSTWASGPAQLGYGDGDEATVVSFGSDSSNKYITTYFRHAFEVADAAAISAMTLRLLRDDGAVVYLNGVEIFRSNMPTGTIAYLTSASSNGNETTFYEIVLDSSLLVSGTNVLAVEVHQRDAQSSDISFDLELVAGGSSPPPALPTVTIAAADAVAAESGPDQGLLTITRTGSTTADLVVSYTVSGTASNGVDYLALSGAATILAGSSSVTVAIDPIDDALAESEETATLTLSSNSAYDLGTTIAATVKLADNDTQVLVPAGSTWKFLDNGSDQGSAWREASFDDSGWSAGPAQLGYGDNDEATVVGFGLDSRNKYITTYFRLGFDISDPADFSALTLKLLRDDGAVVYVNGVEVVRSNMPTGGITHTTRASSTVNGASEDAFFTFAVDPSLLVSGINVLAVEVHQRDSKSSDVSFDLELIGTLSATPTVTVAATDASASEAGEDGGAFMVARTGSTAADLVVSYTLGGSATNGEDYDALSGTVTIPAGSGTVTLAINPVDDALAEGQENVELILLSNSGYELGAVNSDTVALADNEAETNTDATSMFLDDGDQGFLLRKLTLRKTM